MRTDFFEGQADKLVLTQPANTLRELRKDKVEDLGPPPVQGVATLHV